MTSTLAAVNGVKINSRSTSVEEENPKDFITRFAIQIIQAVGCLFIAAGVGCILVATPFFLPIGLIASGVALLVFGVLSKGSATTLLAELQPLLSTESFTSANLDTIDSSKIIHCSAPNPLRNRADFLSAGLPTPPLVIGKSDFVSRDMVRHLMADKKKLALGVKYVKGDLITNMEGALHTFVTPIGPIMMPGDYRWEGVVKGPQFADNQVRPMILSAAIHPDFERDTVVMPIVEIRDECIEGVHLTAAEMDAQLRLVNRSDDVSREKYDDLLRRHMIYQLMADHRLAAIGEINPKDIYSYEDARLYLDTILENEEGQIQESVSNKYVEVPTSNGKNSIFSLEALLNIYIHQVRNEFKVLNQQLPQGYVYTISPPSIFTRFINGNAILLNRLQGLAFKYLLAKEPGLFTGLRVLAFSNHRDKGMPLNYKKVFKGSDVQVIPFIELYDPSTSAYIGPEGLALIVHNNSDGFGQNIEFEGPSSMDGMIGSYSNAACLLKRDRPDLVDNIL